MENNNRPPRQMYRASDSGRIPSSSGGSGQRNSQRNSQRTSGQPAQRNPQRTSGQAAQRNSQRTGARARIRNAQYNTQYNSQQNAQRTGARTASRQGAPERAAQGARNRRSRESNVYVSSTTPPTGQALSRNSYGVASSYGARRKKSKLPIIIGVSVVAVVAIVAVLFTVGPLKTLIWPGETKTGTTAQTTTQTTSGQRVSIVAVGDNLPDDDIGYDADARAGEMGDGNYDYSHLYENVKSYIQAADIAIVTEETVCAGNEIGPQDYECFNACDQLADAIVGAGFDIVALAANHIYDWMQAGVIHNAELWESKPITQIGSHSSSNASTVELVDKNGIKFAFLNYTYGVNGKRYGDVPWYEVRWLTEDNVRADVERAYEKKADAIIVVVHWGIEKETLQSEDQDEWAQLFADLGVDLVIGSHPHVIQPMTWVTGADGSNCLVAYSLGNFTSNFQNYGDVTQLGGMLSCDFVKDDKGNVTIENATWTGLINHNEEGNYTVYALPDYTPELAARQPYFAHLDDPIAFAKEKFSEIVNALGNNFVLKGISEGTTSSDSTRVVTAVG